MIPAITNGVCRHRGAHCAWCQTHAEWRQQVGTTKPCGDARGPGSAPVAEYATTERPGTELKRILTTMHIRERVGCSCGALAAQMDRWGCEECSARVAEIVQTLRIEAKNRGWPFSNTVAAALVRLAISNERAKAA